MSDGAAEVCIDGVWYWLGIEDHRPLLARLRELAPKSDLLTLSKGCNQILMTDSDPAKLTFADGVPPLELSRAQRLRARNRAQQVVAKLRTKLNNPLHALPSKQPLTQIARAAYPAKTHTQLRAMLKYMEYGIDVGKYLTEITDSEVAGLITASQAKYLRYSARYGATPV